jgi:type IX secretion system PorP/SprF family membrane protein
MIMKKIFFSIAVMVLFQSAFAQQLTSVSQYMENKYVFNPAAVGTLPYSPLALSYKRMWTGVDDAPTMQMISSHFQAADNMGIGGKVFNYSAGAMSKMGIEGTYAYQLPIGTNGAKLSLGLSAQLYQFYLNKSKLTLEQQDDEVMLFGSEKLISPDAAFGAYYYTDKYFAGLSVYQLFNRKVDMMTDKILENRQVRHYFISAGYNFDLNANFSIEPSFLAKVIEAGIAQVDINAKVTYKQTVWLGLSFRTKDAIAVNLGLRKDRFIFGYSYDYSITDIKKYNVGSHELFFIVKFNRSKPKL